MDLESRVAALELELRLRGEQIELHQATLVNFASVLQSVLGSLGKLTVVAEELTVKDFVAGLESVDKCGKHCGCENHNG